MFEEAEIRLYASHSQFYVQDSEPRGDTGDPKFWTDRAIDDHLAIADGILGIGTGSYAFVRVRVEEHESEPALTLTEWDHVVEADLELRTSRLFVMGVAFSGLFFDVRQGNYRVRCCQANLAASIFSQTEQGGDWYLVQFWASQPSEPKVLKRWTGSRAW
jgi:hypothetical protein